MTFLWIAAATLASEDLACVGAGLLVARGDLDWLTAVSACAAGIFFGDLGLYGAGRLLPLKRARWERARRWFARSGEAFVFTSRFLPGFRVATYLAAGALRMPLQRFVGYLGSATVLWTSLIVGVTAWLGRAPSLLWLAVPALAFWTLRRSKWRRWEFWPAWLAYLPLVPYLAWLMVRFRSVTLPLRANPGMKNGGLVGESKSESLAYLRAGAPEHVPLFVLADSVADVRWGEYPVVLKPDVGERGNGVVIARSAAEVDAYFASHAGSIIVQRYVGGEEFGLYYRRWPGAATGELISVTRKTFPEVVGDGTRTIGELVEDDERARRIAKAYRASCRRSFDEVPLAGERVPLVEIGSHCRGAIFLDGSALWTAALAAAVDRVAQAHPGFYLGRFDVRAASAEALRRGEFQVLELNGVGAEPAHIYDPAVSIWSAYRTLAAHWRSAFAIGAKLRTRGPAFG
jgi:membrane protein DedA with SNARE-associated domain